MIAETRKARASWGGSFVKTLVLVLLISSATLAQEHAPTVEQCRADYRLWTANLDFKDISYHELLRRAVEMNQCTIVDPDGMQAFLDEEKRLGWKNASIIYPVAGSLFQHAADERMTHFVTRHHLLNQFLDEDAAGKR